MLLRHLGNCKTLTQIAICRKCQCWHFRQMVMKLYPGLRNCKDGSGICLYQTLDNVIAFAQSFRQVLCHILIKLE